VDEIEALYRRYAPDVFRFAYYLSGERSDAEDITSETFVRVWTSAAPIRTATVRAYLFTIARNVFLKARRHQSRHVDLESHLPADSRTPHDAIETRSDLDAVLARLRSFPAIDRAAVLMRARDDMAYEEIAEALGISVGAARVRIHRVRRALADLRSDSPSPSHE
jgi:RNA polymerase sigma-70 factor, ECF subfamily